MELIVSPGLKARHTRRSRTAVCGPLYQHQADLAPFFCGKRFRAKPPQRSEGRHFPATGLPGESGGIGELPPSLEQVRWRPYAATREVFEPLPPTVTRRSLGESRDATLRNGIVTTSSNR